MPAKLFIMIFVTTEILITILGVECYPFSCAPMFCNQVNEYTIFEILNEAGEPQRLEAFQLHQIYDGNPVNLGVGVLPLPTLNTYGQRPSKEFISSHLESQNIKDISNENLVVTQKTFGWDKRNNSFGLIESTKWFVKKTP
jgi:hypothetical protein